MAGGGVRASGKVWTAGYDRIIRSPRKSWESDFIYFYAMFIKSFNEKIQGYVFFYCSGSGNEEEITLYGAVWISIFTDDQLIINWCSANIPS